MTLQIAYEANLHLTAGTAGKTFSIGGSVVRSIIRWAGSKKRQLNTLANRSPREFNKYLEPFAGSACLFARLSPQKSVIGDLNEDLIHTFRQLAYRPRVLHEKLSGLADTEKSYYNLRAQSPRDMSATDRAVRFLYLNRLAFNGVYRTNKLGEFNVPYGDRAPALAPLDDFLEWGRRMRTAKLLCEDFETTLGYAKGGDFAYIDPPYTSAGRPITGEYGCDSFAASDVERLLACLRRLDRKRVKFLFSYCLDEDVLRGLDPKWRVQRVRVMRNVGGFASSRRRATEILVSNYD